MKRYLKPQMLGCWNIIWFLSYLGFHYHPSYLLGFKSRQTITGAETTPLVGTRQFRTNILAFTGGGKNPRFQPQNVPWWQQAVFEWRWNPSAPKWPFWECSLGRFLGSFYTSWKGIWSTKGEEGWDFWVFVVATCRWQALKLMDHLWEDE